MRKLSTVIASFCTFALFGSTYAQTSLPNELRFIKMDSFREEPNLPPNISAKFVLACNQTFHKILRVDVTDPNQNNKVYIFIAALALEDPTLNCTGTKTVTAAAGQSFSGRSYEIQPVSDHFVDGLPFTVKFREAKEIFEQGGVLHPKLKVIIPLTGREKIVHTTREDLKFYPNHQEHVIVFAGSLVLESLQEIANDRDETVFYGYTYTRTSYELKKITRLISGE